MKNFVQDGNILTLTAPYARSAGQGALVGSIFGVAANDVAITKAGEFQVEGVFTLDKTSAQAWAVGDKIYWDDINKRCDNVATVGMQIGVAQAVAANPSATGNVRLDGIGTKRPLTVYEGTPAPTSINTAGAVTYTAAQLLSGIIVRDPNGGSRTDVLPTAALLVAAVPNAKVGDLIEVGIVNGADAAEVITIQAGAGGAFDANQTASSQVIGQNTSKTLRVRLTNVTPAAEAYVAYL